MRLHQSLIRRLSCPPSLIFLLTRCRLCVVVGVPLLVGGVGVGGLWAEFVSTESIRLKHKRSDKGRREEYTNTKSSPPYTNQ